MVQILQPTHPWLVNCLLFWEPVVLVNHLPMVLHKREQEWWLPIVHTVKIELFVLEPMLLLKATHETMSLEFGKFFQE